MNRCRAERMDNMLARRKESRVSPDSIDFFVSIMLRYPEIATIKYDPARCRVKFTFIVSGVVSAQNCNKWADTLLKTLDAYYHLENKKISEIGIENTTCDQITLIEISRDVQSLCVNEIGIIVNLFKDRFAQDAMVDSYGLVGEDLLFRDEMIRHTLESLKHAQLEKKLIALREEGRVLVFNK